MANRFYEPRPQFIDANGNPYASGTLEFYQTGTSTPQDTYSNNALSVPNDNPLSLGSDGRPDGGVDVFLAASPAYKIILKDSAGATVFTWDPVQGPLVPAEATQNETDARTSSTTFVSPRRLATGLGLQGSDITDGAALAIPDVGDIFDCPGTTTATSMTFTTGRNGRFFRLVHTGVKTLTHSATDLICLGGANVVTAVGDISSWVRISSGNKVRMTDYARAAGTPLISTGFRSYLAGLGMSNAADADHDITIAVGLARDATNAKDMTLGSAMTKQIDAAWVAGSAAGGFPSGLVLGNATWYHVFIIGKTDGTVDAGFDTSLTAVNLLADATAYTYYRRIGSVLTNGSANIIAFTQLGDEFLWVDPPLDVSTANPGTSAVTPTMSTPLGIKVRGLFNVSTPHNNTGIYLSSPAVNDEAPTSGTAPLTTFALGNFGSQSFTSSVGPVPVRTDTSSRIRYRISADQQTYIATLGWLDRRGRDD